MGQYLFILEDPGAANYLLPVYRQLFQKDEDVQLWASVNLKPLINEEDHPNYWSPSDDDDISVPTLLTGVSCVVIGTSENPDGLGLQIVPHCRRLNIPVVAGVDGPANPEYRFRGRSDTALSFCPDYIFVADQFTANSYIALGLASTRIFVVGHPQFDNMVEVRKSLEEEGQLEIRKRLFPDLDEKKRLVVFCAELSDGLDPTQFQKNEDYLVDGWGNTQGRTEIVLEEVIDAVKSSSQETSLIVRLHPKNSEVDFSDYTNSIDGFSQGGHPHETIYAADFVVGLSSIVLYEAAVLGCQTVSILPRQSEESWLGSIAAGLTPCLHTREEIKEYFENETRPMVRDITPVGASDEMVRVMTHVLGVG